MSNIKNTPDSLKAYVSSHAIKTFVDHGIFTKEELHARLEIMLEEYIKTIQIEGRVLADLVYTYVLPAAIEYLSTLANNVKMLKDVNLKAGTAQLELIESISNYIDDAKKHTDKMILSRKKANTISDTQKMATTYHQNVRESFDKIRYNVDKLELLVNDKLWQLPKYRELLFIK